MGIQLEITAFTICTVVPLLVPVTARSKAWVCSCSLAGIDGSNTVRCCATNREVAGSILDGVIGLFH